MKVLLAILAVLIAYGSLYPFDFGVPHADAIKRITSTLFDPFATEQSDILGNIALFIPFGFVGVLAFPRFRPIVSLLGLVFPVGTLFALILQIGQIFVPERDPSLVDVFWNAIGLALGGVAALAPVARRLQVSLSDPARLEVPVALAGCWIASQLVPFVPSVDLQSLKDGLKALLLTPNLNLGEACLQTAAWLVALYFLSSSNLQAGYKRLLPAVPLAVLAAQPFIIRNGLTLDEVIGGFGGLLIWSVAGRVLRPAVLATVLGVTFVAVNLAGLNLDAPGQLFSWIPFNDLLQGSMVFNVGVLLDKLFVYGALVWLMKEAGLDWTRATAITVVVLAVVELLQIHVPNSTAGTTDPLLAVLIAAAMSAMSNSRQAAFARHRAVAISAARHNVLRNGTRTAPVKPGASSHLGSLDGLRGFAALSVFAVHFQQAAHVQGKLGPFDLDRFLTNGNSGVALFFVLSGFLLSIPFWTAHANRATPVDLKAYGLRRLARILPAYYLLLFLLLSASAAMGTLPSINNMLSHLLFLHNLKDDSILSINPPFWTLAVEMQFYILLPLLFLTLGKISSRTAFAAVLALSVLSYFANYEVMTTLLRLNHWPIVVRLIWPFALDISGPESFVLTYSTLAHLTFFFTGVSAAWLFLRMPPAASPRGFASAAVMDLLFWISAAAVLVILSTPLDDVLQFPFGHYNWPYVPFLFAVMVLAGPGAVTARAALGLAPVRWLGLISYGVYIFHYPVLRVVEIVMTALNLDVTRYWFLFGGAGLIGTVILASNSYLLMEKPIMDAARRKRPMQRETAQSEASARALSSGWVKVPLGLRSEHVDYLNDVASENGRTLSGATRYVIAEFIRQLSAEDAAPQTPRKTRGLELGSMLAARVERLGEEQEHLVNLPEEQREFLGALSARLGTTVSRTVQIIVDQFISEKPLQPKSSAAKGAYG